MGSRELNQFLQFLQPDLATPNARLQRALRHPEQAPRSVPMTLWPHGLVRLTPLNQMFDWLDDQISS